MLPVAGAPAGSRASRRTAVAQADAAVAAPSATDRGFEMRTRTLFGVVAGADARRPGRRQPDGDTGEAPADLAGAEHRDRRVPGPRSPGRGERQAEDGGHGRLHAAARHEDRPRGGPAVHEGRRHPAGRGDVGVPGVPHRHRRRLRTHPESWSRSTAGTGPARPSSRSVESRSGEGRSSLRSTSRPATRPGASPRRARRSCGSGTWAGRAPCSRRRRRARGAAGGSAPSS